MARQTKSQPWTYKFICISVRRRTWLSTASVLGALVLHTAYAASAEDATILLAFRDSFQNGDKVLDSWSAWTDPCGWAGIGCNSTGFVEKVWLVSLGLEGTIPPDTGWMLPESVVYLHLNKNNISGSIPAGWRLPASLSLLDLSGNRLSGSISPNWDLSDSQLQDLRLFRNNLSGTLPDQWRLPPGISSINIAINSLSGTIPTALTTLVSPTLVNLSTNRLSGRLPSNFTFRSSEAGSPPPRLLVNMNLLTGPLPTWPDAPQAQVGILPGNEGLCIEGKLPDAPRYLISNGSNQDVAIDSSSVPPCHGSSPESPPDLPVVDSGPGSSKAGLVAGLAVGLGCSAVFAAGGFLYCRRRRKGQAHLGRSEEPEVAKEWSTGSMPDGAEENLSTAAEGRRSGGLSSLSQNGSERILPASGTRLRSSLAPLGTSNSGGNGGSSCAAPPIASAISGIMSGSSGWRQLGVNADAFQIPFSDLALDRQIGSGSFARVYLGSWRSTTVACKLLLGPEAGSGGSGSRSGAEAPSATNPLKRCLKQEASMMAALRHPNVLGFMGLCTTPPCLVIEYCPRGSLHDLLRQASASPELARQLTWARRLHMARGAALGMLYLHSHQPPILHRDLKSPNVLVDAAWNVKISDFNLSKILGENSLGVLNSSAAGNPRWLAPEILAGEAHTFASDVFSFGLVLWELLTLKAPWEGQCNPWQISSRVLVGERPVIPDQGQLPGGDVSFEGLADYIALIRQCWAQDKQERPPFSEVAARIGVLLVTHRSPMADTCQPRTLAVRKAVKVPVLHKHASPFAQGCTP